MKKILMVNEASFLSTGYAVYGKEVLSRLHAAGYEVAELATYCVEGEARLKSIPWKVYPNIPHEGSPARENFHHDSTHQFGEFCFENVLLDFKPDVVMDIRDYWMFEFEARSPLRPYFNWVVMPTADAFPQQEQWIATYQEADAVLTYQDWSGQILKDQSGGKINWCGSASPAASDKYKPETPEMRRNLKSLLGLGPDITVIGTVMRNQRRKLYPEFFKAFRKFLDKTGRKDVVLYCHTSYPDNGWDIPSLLKEFGLCSKVFFTYICKDTSGNGCGYAFPTLFQDALAHCPQCGQRMAHLASVQTGVSEEILARAMSMFDLYVQYANSEGFGMPQVEAAACGTPVTATDYSAMGDIVRKVGGYPIPPRMLYRELETGCNRAYPDEDAFVEILEKFCSLPTSMKETQRIKTRQLFEANYGWDKTAYKWMEVIDSLGEPKKKWDAPPRITQPAQPGEFVNQMDNATYVRWLINYVLGEPERANTYFESRLIRDLNYGVQLRGMSGLYLNEQAHMFDKPNYEPFNREHAYNEMALICHRRNQWESIRTNSA